MKDIIPKIGDAVWACAYQTDNNQITMGYIRTPVRGMICNPRGMGIQRWQDEVFVEFGKNGQLKKSSSVSKSARKYASTKEECTELYNSLVTSRIQWLEDRISEANTHFIDEVE